MEVTSERHAADILRKIVNNDVEINPQELVVGDWADLEIHIPGESYVLPTTVMRGILALQQSVYRGSAVILDGKPNITYLTAREKEMLTLKAIISEGSTDVKIDVNELVASLVGPLVGKLSGNQIVGLILTGMLVWGGDSFYRNYASDNLKNKEIEMEDVRNQRLMAHLERHSEQDELVIGAINASGGWSTRSAQLLSVHNNATPDIIKGLKDAKKSTLGDMPLTPSTVEAITRNPRSESVKRELVGVYKILKVDTTSLVGFRVQVENARNGEIFTAGLDDATVSNTTRSVIEAATFNKTNVAAIVSARIKNGNVMDAKITSAEHVGEEE